MRGADTIKIATLLLFVCAAGVWSDLTPPEPSFRTLMVEAVIEKRIPGPGDEPLFALQAKETRWIDAAANALRIDRVDVFLGPGPRREVNSARIQTAGALTVLDFDLKIAHRFESAAGRFPVWAEGVVDADRVDRRAVHLGRTCDVYMAGATEVWAWNGIVMRKIVENEDAVFRYEVTRVVENPAISKEKFMVPPGFKVERNAGIGGAPPPGLEAAPW